MSGRLFAYWGEQGAPKQIGSSGRYFGFGWDRILDRWRDDSEWFRKDGFRPNFVYRGPMGSPKKVPGRPMVVEFDGYYINQMKNVPEVRWKRLDKITNNLEETLSNFIKDNDVSVFLCYLGKFYSHLKNLYPEDKQRVLYISTMPYLSSGCEIGFDSLSLEIPGSPVQLYAKWLASETGGKVWGETVPANEKLKGWSTINIICTQLGWNKWIKTGERVGVDWTDCMGTKFMLWVTAPPPKTKSSAIKQMNWVMARRMEGYDVAFNINRARKAEMSCEQMHAD
jgi:hypothetical protein